MGGDRGWTPLASLLCVLIYIEVFYWYSTKMCINLEVWSVWFELESHLFVDIGRMWIWYMWFTVISLARFWAMLIKLESKTYLRQWCHETVKWSNWLFWLTICWMLMLYSLLICGLVYFYWAVAHPLWEHHFQVQVISYLQGLSLGGLGFWRLFLVICFFFYC